VIDFRYHLVSLIAVFLAIALGIVIGTTALNQPILADIKGQVSSLEQDKRTLEGQTRTLQAQVNADSAFATAVAPGLVAGTLSNRKVLIVVTSDQVPGGTVDQMSAMIAQAGGTVSGTLDLKPQYTDPGKASAIESYVTGSGLPAGIDLPASGDSKQQVATLLADVLMVPSGHSATEVDTAAITSVLAGLSTLGVLSQGTATVTPADYAILLTTGTQTGNDADVRNTALVDLAAALDAAGSGAVVAGDTTAVQDNGLISVVRGNTSVSTSVSTVDNVDRPVGQISTVLALGRERQGASGKYGTGPGTQAIPPVPGVTQ
jgi:hypothetical protein